MKRTVLFISVGRTDLQFLGAKDGERYRIPAGRNLRHLHEALLDGVLPYRLEPELVDLKEVRRDVAVDWNLDTGSVELRDRYEVNYEAGSMTLIPAKLAPPVRELVGRMEEIQITAIVLLATERDHRTPHGVYHNEPVAAAPILASWLARVFSLDPGTEAGVVGLGKVGWVNIMDGAMLSPGSERDYPVNREALRRVERVFAEALTWFECPWACLSLGGGLPPFHEPIKTCADYLFDGRVFSWQAPQYQPKSFAWVAPDDETPAPAESYRVRRHVEQLVGRGSFIEAHGAARQLENDTRESEWVGKVGYATEYFRGALGYSKAAPADMPEYVRKLLEPPPGRERMPRCLLVALRVEAALWANRTQEAVTGTATFLEAAALDALEDALPAGYRLDDRRERIVGPRFPHHVRKRMQNLVVRCQAPDKPRPQTHRPPPDPLRESWSSARKNVVEFRYAVGPGTLDYLTRIFPAEQRTALRGFRNALSPQNAMAGRTRRNYETRNPENIEPIKFRHLSVHSLLSPSMASAARTAFTGAGLWSSSARAPGEQFLAQPQVSSVLRSFSLGDAAQLYSEVVEGLIHDMRSFEI